MRVLAAARRSVRLWLADWMIVIGYLLQRRAMELSATERERKKW